MITPPKKSRRNPTGQKQHKREVQLSSSCSERIFAVRLLKPYSLIIRYYSLRASGRFKLCPCFRHNHILQPQFLFIYFAMRSIIIWPEHIFCGIPLSNTRNTIGHLITMNTVGNLVIVNRHNLNSCFWATICHWFFTSSPSGIKFIFYNLTISISGCSYTYPSS